MNAGDPVAIMGKVRIGIESIARSEKNLTSNRTSQFHRQHTWTSSVCDLQSVIAICLLLASTAFGQTSTFNDSLGDVLARPMDPGAILPFDTEMHHLVDLQSITLGLWAPDDVTTDLFAGTESVDGLFFRLEVKLDGLVNPPGSADPFSFNPFRYGDHPVYGFIEIDMDGDVATGGELDAPQYRYLGNAVRFGGKVLRPEFSDRVAVDGSDFDFDFLTPPFVERHGEEFHLALLGGQFGPSDIEEVEGDGDFLFESGETWNIRGEFFHRAHGYELFSFVEGGQYPGEYAPICDLQFRHDEVEDATYVTLVFPFTNLGAGLIRNELAQPSNQDPTDHASILEGLEDLQLSAFLLPILPTGLPEEEIIINWAERDPSDFLDPTSWSVTAILGSSYTAPHATDIYFLWSDIYPNVVVGDVDGSGTHDAGDTQLIARHIAEKDFLDGIIDGIVTIVAFASDFSVFDVNHDGIVSAIDLTWDVRDADSDQDGDVDLFDIANLQRCFGQEGSPSETCSPLDIVTDQKIDLADVLGFSDRLTGPQ